jgi:hypothetical protein
MKINELLLELRLRTKAHVVYSWAERFDLPFNYLVILWKRAICAYLQDGKKKCRPEGKEWGVVTNIFKAEIKKYLSKVNSKIKYVLKNPTVHGKKAHIHYEEAKKISLRQVIEKYKKELQICCKKCPKICM